MIHSVEVYLWGTRVGIASYDFDSVANFEYDKDFINSGIQLSPLYMPLSSKVYSFPSVTYSHHLTSFASLKWVLLAQEI